MLAAAAVQGSEGGRGVGGGLETARRRGGGGCCFAAGGSAAEWGWGGVFSGLQNDAGGGENKGCPGTLYHKYPPSFITGECAADNAAALIFL